MIEMSINVHNLDTLRANFRRAPALTLKYLAKATKASIFEVEKHVTEGGIMQFKTPRPRRTGALVARWGAGRYRGFSRDGLSGYTGPSVKYAPYVYYGTRRGQQPNRYLDRIRDAAQPGVEQHFNSAVKSIVNKLA